MYSILCCWTEKAFVINYLWGSAYPVDSWKVTERSWSSIETVKIKFLRVIKCNTTRTKIKNVVSKKLVIEIKTNNTN